MKISIIISRKKILIVSMFLCIISCRKEDQLLTQDEFKQMTGSHTINQIFVDGKLSTSYEYLDSRLYKAAYFDNENKILSYGFYEFNESNLISKIEYKDTNNITTSSYEYEYDENLLLTVSNVYRVSSGKLQLYIIRKLEYDSDTKRLLRIDYCDKNGELNYYEKYSYNENGDYKMIDYYYANDLFSYTINYEWDSKPNIYSKMYTLPWMGIHNITKQTDYDGTINYSMNYDDKDYVIKLTETYYDGSEQVIEYTYN